MYILREDPYEKQLKELDARRPDRPEFQSLLGADGMIQSQYQLADQMNTQAMDQYRQEALRGAGTNSMWADLMNQELASQRTGANDSLARQGASLQSQALADMASRGGYDGASQERMGRQSFRDMLRQKQNNRQDFERRQLDIYKTDESNRQNMLQNQVGFDQNRANYLGEIDRTNKGAAMTEFGNQRNYGLDTYKEDLNAWGSERNAIATERASRNSGGGKK